MSHSRWKMFIKKTSSFRVFLLVLFTGVLSSCENDIEKVTLITSKKSQAVETSADLQILYSDSSRVKVKINTPVLNRYSGEKPLTEMPKGLHVEFYDELMQVTSTLTANFALRHDNEGLMEARNNVVVVNKKGEKLNTEHLVWNEKTAKIYSDEFVKITTPDKIILGDGFEANQDFTNYKIFKIKGTITLPKK